MNKQEWISFLKTPKKDLTDQDWEKARNHSQTWFACAVGCKIDLPCNLVPEELDESEIALRNSWIDGKLTKQADRLGKEFFWNIRTKNLAKARRTFKQIMGLKRVFKPF